MNDYVKFGIGATAAYMLWKAYTHAKAAAIASTTPPTDGTIPIGGKATVTLVQDNESSPVSGSAQPNNVPREMIIQSADAEGYWA